MNNHLFQKLIVVLLITNSCILSLTACAANPEKDIVTSKNNGMMQDVIYSTESNGGNLEIRSSRVTWKDEFTSTDGSVNFSVDIDISAEASRG